MQDLEIGTVTIGYDENGNVTLAQFTPTILIELDDNLSTQLKSIESSNDSETIQHNADLMLASFFNTMNNIELADHEKYKIVSEVVNCEKYQSGKVKICSLKYLFKELKN